MNRRHLQTGFHSSFLASICHSAVLAVAIAADRYISGSIGGTVVGIAVVV